MGVRCQNEECVIAEKGERGREREKERCIRGQMKIVERRVNKREGEREKERGWGEGDGEGMRKLKRGDQGQQEREKKRERKRERERERRGVVLEQYLHFTRGRSLRKEWMILENIEN